MMQGPYKQLICGIAVAFVLIAHMCMADVVDEVSMHMHHGTFTFMYGLDRGGQLSDLATIGLNTLYIDLQPDELQNPAPVRQQIREASAAGYKVIVGIPTTTFPGFRIGPTAEKYRGAVSELISTTIGQFGAEPGVTAWATGHYLEKYIRPDDDDFRAFLEQRYGSLEGLNAAWGVSYPNWRAITLLEASGLDADELFGVGRVSTDIADFKVWAFGEVMRHWAQTVKSADSARPLLTGAMTLYTSIAALPDGYDIACVSMPPEIMHEASHAYGDSLTHNVHAVDMARRAGHFEVIQVLRLPLPGQPGYPTSLGDWVREADLHGACGVALESWERYPAHAGQATVLLRPLCSALQQSYFCGKPKPASAVLYSPYAEGFQVLGQPLYGHLKGFASGQPTNPLETLRMGTCFGAVDVLTPDDLMSTDLRNYSLIMAPSALGLDGAQCQVLADYVRAGGSLIADIGIGMRYTGSWLNLPPELAPVFGIRTLSGGTARAGTLRVSGGLPELPHVKPGTVIEGTFQPSIGPSNGSQQTVGARSYSVGSHVLYATLTSGSQALATLDVKTVEESTPEFAGVICNRFGRGIGIYATHLMYPYWPLDDKVNTGLHYDLMLRRATCELLDTPFLPASTEISLEANSLRILNASSEPASHSIGLYGQGDRLVMGAVTRNRASRTDGGEMQTVDVHVPEKQLLDLPLTNIRLQPYDDEVSAAIAELGSSRILLSVAGPGASLDPSRASPFRFSRPVASENVRFSVPAGGVYDVVDGTHHLVTVTPERGEAHQFEVVAENGALVFSTEIYRDRVEVTPVR